MNTRDIACKLIDMLDRLCASARMMHGLRHSSDLLPLVIGKCGWMQPTKALILILDGSPLIAWGICCIKFITKHSSYSILVKEPGTKALTTGAIACIVQGIGYLVGFYISLERRT